MPLLNFFKAHINFFIFCFVGIISTLIDICLLYIGVEFFNLKVLISATLSFIVASINGYILNKKITFKHDKTPTNGKQYLQFLFVSIIGLIFTLVFMYTFVELLNIFYIYAKIITVILVVFWNYNGNLFWTFKKMKKLSVD